MEKPIIKEINNFLDINNLIDAKKLAKEFILREPSSEEGYLALSDIYYEEENFNESLEIINKGLDNVPNSKRLLESRIDLELALTKYEDAKNTINILINMKEVSASTYGRYGLILSMEGKHKEAIEQYKLAIEADKEDIVSMVNMSIAYKAIYKYDDALAILQRAYSINKSKSIEKRINVIKKNKEDSIFIVDTMVPLIAKPDNFNLLIPKDFNANLEDGVLYIKSKDEKIAVILSYGKTKYDEKNINDMFKAFRNDGGTLYSIVRPFSITKRDKYNDIFASTIFTSKLGGKDMFYAMSLVVKENESIILTLSSSILISDNLITLASSIIDSVYFKNK